jgi:hypothetical protein
MLIDPTPNKCPNTSKWVLKCKLGFNGEGVLFKVSLVVGGFEQQVGLDYHETFALIVKWETLHIIVRIATHKH